MCGGSLIEPSRSEWAASPSSIGGLFGGDGGLEALKESLRREVAAAILESPPGPLASDGNPLCGVDPLSPAELPLAGVPVSPLVK
jgi:hypothetical protein